MPNTHRTIDEALAAVPSDQVEAVGRLRALFNAHLPPGFEETVSSGMLSWVVPHRLYPAGYHCDPKQPLPFLSVAPRKGFVAVYHMGLIAGPLQAWFVAEWPKRTRLKLDLGKSCLRLKKPDEAPWALLEELAAKMTPAQWIAQYEAVLAPRR
jgi:hypothetical protein